MIARRPRLRRTSLIATLALLILSAPAAAVDWVDWGPAPIFVPADTGRVSAVAVSATDPNLYYAAGCDGGVWRTTDGGQSWTPLTDHMPTSAMGALALDPTNEQVVYAGTGEANYANHSRYGLGLYKSSDGGDTWEHLAEDVFAGRCFSKIIVSPANPQRVFASITRAGGFPELAAAKGHPGATGPVGVFRSEDGGVTWSQMTNGLPNLSATDLVADPSNPDILYAGIGRIFGSTDNGVYKTTDGGDSWAKLGGGLPSGAIGRVSVTVAPSNPARLYALITQPSNAAGGNAAVEGAYRSDDAGATWVDLPTVPIDLQATYGWFLSIAGVNPTDPDMVIMGGVPLARNDTAGTGQWYTITPPHVDMHAIAWDAAGRLVIGDDGGVHRSPDNGVTWQALNNGLGTIQCYAGLSTHPTNPFPWFVGTQDNGTLKKITFSALWSQRLGGDGGWTQINPNNTYYVYAEFQGTGNLYRATDGGTTFNWSAAGIQVGDRNAFMPPYLVDPLNVDRMLYATHRIYRSLDRGGSWSVQSGDLTGGGDAAIRALAMAPSNTDVVYAATNDGRILVSDDFGQTWTLILDGVPGWPRVTRELFVHPTDPDTMYLATAYFGETQIRRTTDRGQTWEPLDANFPDIPVNVVAVDVRGNLPVIYAGADNTLYRSVDDGGSWHRYGVGFPTSAVVDLRLEVDRGRMVVATQGRGVWEIAVGLPGDMNGDELVNAGDIDAFVLALTDPDGYAAQYPDLDPLLGGDVNGDNLLNAGDIDPFVTVLVGG